MNFSWISPRQKLTILTVPLPVRNEPVQGQNKNGYRFNFESYILDEKRQNQYLGVLAIDWNLAAAGLK